MIRKNLSARFLKSGANDFLHKPFSAEELYCRIIQNLDLLDYIRTIWDMSHRDSLTGLANRRWFFQRGQEMLHQVEKHGASVGVAMLDLDHFKRINDTYGHEIGDAVLCYVAQQLQTHFGAGLVGRLGGEEFAVVLESASQDMWEAFRQAIASHPAPTLAGPVDVQVSMGVCFLPGANLERHLACADALLYRAKHRGRNRVEIGSEPCPEK
jgi:diguanylate cyclase (GGDEF)-like protein